MQSTPEAIPQDIHDLIIEIVKIRNENVVKFISHDTSIYMKPIVRFMPDLEHCVENLVRQNVFKIDTKFQEFVTIIHQNYINDKCDALKNCVKFMIKLHS